VTDLYPYQQEGAAWLAERPRALLADEQGLGKTAQAVAACDTTLSGNGNIAIVCPASVTETWRREFARFSKYSHRVLVESYDKIARGAWGNVNDLDCLILDECHYLKTPTAKRTCAIFGEKCDGVGGLVERADRVILLSGTPVPNHPAELWPALRALAPETITSPKSGKPYTYWQFVAKYCKTRDNGFGIQIVGAKNHDKLAEALKPFMLRRLKADVLKDLPPIRYDTLYLGGRIPIEMKGSPEAERIRDTIERDGIAGLKAIASHVATLRRLTGLAKVALVVDWVKTWLECGDGKIVLFAQHREVIEALHQGIGAKLMPLTGDTPAAVRQKIIDRFQNDPRERVFIGQLQAAGTGITLTASSDVVFVESSWTPAENSQAAMRVHRIGQANACMIRFATLAGSIDEQIQRVVARKTEDISRVLDVEN
jgi:SWI/SNF-related matrix-associated actin-dependent regulator 1 of chromatin subfamily A